ncbi:Tat pathway signal sequence domain protein [Streptomyces maremycinicus]|nr:Tat pathway signal sequence domain protein [Streptomyces sp. B9173]
MRPRPPIQGRGIFSGTGLIITGLAATLAALVFPIWSYADRSGTGVDVLNAQTVSTQYGPLSALDRDFITKVRLAGLWELPAGQQAQTKGTTEAVRTAGRHLVQGHTFLDERVRTVASQLGLALPDEPNDQQKGWLSELDAAQGGQYDWKFANIARLAHGRVFSVVAQVRAGTRNSLVRGLADDANTTVLDHIKILEATGFVDFDALARDLAAGSTPSITRSPAPPGPTADPGSAVPVTPSPSPTYPLPPAAASPPPGT